MNVMILAVICTNSRELYTLIKRMRMGLGMRLITKPLKQEAWALKYAFSMFVVKLYSFCLSIAYIGRRHHPYIESLPTL